MVFVSSLSTGMGVLVSRFAGAGDRVKADRAVYQAFLTSTVMSFGILAPLGYVLAPTLLSFVNATPAV
ncbi:MatE [compost metagenome]